jgi:uncharacterized membrane protein
MLETYGNYIVALAMAATTYLLRIGGFWLIGQIGVPPALQRAFDALPGSIIIAICMPTVLSGGTAAHAGMLTTLAVMIGLRNELLAVGIGLAVVIGARAAGL